MIEIMKPSDVVPPLGVPVIRKICDVMCDSEPGTMLRLKGTGTEQELRTLANNACTRLRQLDIRSRYVIVDNSVVIFHRGYLSANVFDGE